MDFSRKIFRPKKAMAFFLGVDSKKTLYILYIFWGLGKITQLAVMLVPSQFLYILSYTLVN